MACVVRPKMWPRLWGLGCSINWKSPRSSGLSPVDDGMGSGVPKSGVP